ncbi:putative PEP-binding protein [Methylobacterium oryzae CBMB20]
MRIGVERGRKTRPNIKLGICGEHGGDPASVGFCQEVGLDYVSCSPYRVPIARLAAAQAASGQGRPARKAKVGWWGAERRPPFGYQPIRTRISGKTRLSVELGAP